MSDEEMKALSPKAYDFRDPGTPEDLIYDIENYDEIVANKVKNGQSDVPYFDPDDDMLPLDAFMQKHTDYEPSANFDYLAILTPEQRQKLLEFTEFFQYLRGKGLIHFDLHHGNIMKDSEHNYVMIDHGGFLDNLGLQWRGKNAR